MNSEEFKRRTKQFAIRVFRLAQSLPQTPECNVIRTQMTKSGTSVAANYRASCRARSSADFISKMGIVEEETDGTLFWIEFLVDTKTVELSLVSDLLREGNEILAMTVSSIRTSKQQTNPKSAIRNPKLT